MIIFIILQTEIMDDLIRDKYWRKYEKIIDELVAHR